MNRRFLGFVLLLIGIVDVFVLDFLLSEVFGIDIYIGRWEWLEYLPYIISATFVIFGLRLIFQVNEDEGTVMPPEVRSQQTQERVNKIVKQLAANQATKKTTTPPVQQPAFPSKEQTLKRMANLTAEQQAYVKSFSFAALLNPLIWAIVQRQPAFIAFMFVPVINVFFWAVLAFKGRQVAWVNTTIDFETLQKREKNALTVALIILSLILVVSNLTETKGF